MERQPPRCTYLLLMVGADNHEPIEGQIRLQKLMFLLEKEILEKRMAITDEGYDFSQHAFMPFSEDVLDDLELLKDLGLVKIEGEKIRLTEKGLEVLRNVLRKDARLRALMKYIEAIKARWNREPEKLSKYICVKYPHYIEKSLIKYLVK